MTDIRDGKVLNPATGRWVKVDGAIGRKLIAQRKSPSPKKIASPQKISPTNKSLSSDKLFFNSKSADVKPGKGANEEVQNPEAYSELAQIKNWRKVLSNFHEHEFKWRGNTYRTIEHAFQAAKISLVNPTEAYKFTVESGTPLGLGDGLAARKARKVVDLKDRIKEWDAISRQTMDEIAKAKYATAPEARRVLAATGKAQLWHLIMRSKTHDHFKHLERIRATL